MSRPLHRQLPLVLCAALIAAALTLLAIGARSPYTHANLGSGPDAGYARTPQTLVGEDPEFAGVGSARNVRAGDPVARGAALYVAAGCAGCHALEGHGGVVGPRIAGIDGETVAQRVRQGPVGMPRFSLGLSDDAVREIAAYLASLGPGPAR